MPRTPKISAKRIKEALEYNPETGSFVWKINTSKTNRIGTEAAPSPANNGYRYISIDGGDILAQRIAFVIMNGDFPDKRITFKDGNRLNLKWENLAEWEWATKSKFNHSTPEGRAEYGRALRSENADKIKNKSLMSDFGIGLSEYNEMLLSQKGCCAICNLPETATRNGKIKALAVDHCHKDNFIRSLLCTKCNVALGAVNDSEEILLKMIAYVNMHKQSQKNSNIIKLNQGSK